MVANENFNIPKALLLLNSWNNLPQRSLKIGDTIFTNSRDILFEVKKNKVIP